MSYPEENERVRDWFDELSDLDELMKKANQFMNYESSTLSLRHYKFPRSHNKDIDASTQLDTNGWFDGSVQTMACELTRETEYDYDCNYSDEQGVLGDYKWSPIELKHLPEELAPTGGTNYTGYLPTEFVFDTPKQMVVPDVARLTRLDGVWALPHSLQATPVKAGGVWCEDGSHRMPKSIHEWDMFKDEGRFGHLPYPEQYLPNEYRDFDPEECNKLMRGWLALYADSHHRAPDVTPYASLINRADVDRLHEILNWLTPGDKGREREPWRVSPGDCRCHPWVKQLRSVWLVEDWENWGDDGHIQNELTGWKLVASNKHFDVDVDTKYSDLINSLTKDTTGDNYEYRPR